jgi:dihydrofolate synthase/folylpolyglutamate synthase
MFDYEQALLYLEGLREFGIKLELERFVELCRRMGNPQDKLSVIHVGGTNGKGSTCAFITSILESAGFRVGTYLSPYVYDVRERIQLNGEMIPKTEFARLMSSVAPVIEKLADDGFGETTEFEAKTILAFLYFAQVGVDYAVIEVGMGGRYDCTNVVKPIAAVITNVSLDHTERLGNTVEQIAWDKAGIAKPGAPLVTAAEDESAWRKIALTAREQGVEEIWRVMRKSFHAPLNSPLHDVEVRFDGHDGVVEIELPNFRIRPTVLRLAGDFQYANAATAAAAVAAMRGSSGVSVSAFENGIAKAYLPGRLEVLRRNPTVVIDAAHNPDGAARLAESLPRLFKWRRLILVIGMLSTHSADGVLLALAPLADKIVATRSRWEKARPASEIAEAARAANPAADVTVAEPVNAAVREALFSADERDLVLITGSFYTIGEVDKELLLDGGNLYSDG